MNPGPKSKSTAATAAAKGNSQPHAAALAEAQLREVALRITPARIKVLAALLEARCAFSHQDMQDQFVEMDRVTLYRALDCLTDAGLAHKIAGDDRVFRYSAGTEHSAAAHQTQHQHQHGHFKCTRCAKVFCLDGSGDAGFLDSILALGDNHAGSTPAKLRKQLQQALQDTLGKGFQGHEIELTIKGWCADCSH
ncbi:Fur family transcriptional regulator [Collimonas sp.]|jgi:Fur family ferric uptake transcriptional regulator|uniref:Fur family transcriptional regulator n=1 Tax=Collimonas sp. TaxID=1963772 RepID=UPI002CDA2D21|nr:transcriptional repressor [Collimonas sp.]HWW06441.1 transcriptional repressor [Collimonas sp.]